jgi:iron complex outermembrane receptor protein
VPFPLLLALAQPPARPDTGRAPRDTARPPVLAPVTVTVTRTPTARDRAPWAVDVVDGRAARAGRLTVGLDEALADVPGVYVANRYNFSVDQRLSIRGAGARANFGARGVRVLLDGVPQTLPDGQSQLTNVDLANLARVEVLRGPASSLYGNAAGGVLAFASDLSAPERGAAARAQAAGGAFGVRKAQARVGARLGGTVAALSASGTTVDGFRQHSAAEQRRLTLAADHALGASTLLALRLHAARDPRARNPGALTAAEWARRADSAAASNVLRGADKRVSQEQLSLGLTRTAGDGARLAFTVFGVRRDLWNPLATPPPGGAGPLGALSPAGTLVEIGRRAGGARAEAAVPLARLAPGGRGPGAPALPVLTLGAEWQAMRDARTNRRATGGRTALPTDTLVLDQVERVSNLAPFAQLAWAPNAVLAFEAAARRDRVRFAVADRFVRDGTDDGGARTLAATSGHVGASARLAAAFAPYVNVSSAFETPTTVELQALPAAGGGVGGFNTALGPQRTRGVEVGARGSVAGGRLTYSAAAYRARVSGAIVQFLETNGRAYFRNAGAATNRGLELGAAVRPLAGAGGRPSDALAVTGAYTLSRFRFGAYRVQAGARVDTLDGRTVPGVPERFARLGVRARPLAWAGARAGGAARALALDADHTWASAVYADDRNAQRVAGWGRGLLDVRARWDAPAAGVRPFAALQNAFGQRYVAAVTVNGANGRVLEPGPGRTAYVGVEVGR